MIYYNVELEDIGLFNKHFNLYKCKQTTEEHSGSHLLMIHYLFTPKNPICKGWLEEIANSK